MNTQMLAWLDQEDAHVRMVVRKFGWFIQYVSGDDGGPCGAPGCDCDDDGRSFAYTIGLFGLDHPELLIFDVAPDTAASVLNEIGHRIRDGENLIPGLPIEVRDWPHGLVPAPLPDPEDYVFGANRFYKRHPSDSVPVLQLTFPA